MAHSRKSKTKEYWVTRNGSLVQRVEAKSKAEAIKKVQASGKRMLGKLYTGTGKYEAFTVLEPRGKELEKEEFIRDNYDLLIRGDY